MKCIHLRYPAPQMHRAEDRTLALPSLSQTALGDPAIRPLLEAAGVWLWDADLVDDTTDYQAGFWEHFGHDPAMMAETFDFLSVMHNGDVRKVAKAWRAHLDGETEIYECEWRLRTGSGTWAWIHSHGRIIERDASGKPTRMVGAYTDVTSAKQAQVALLDSNAELDAVFKSARDGIALVAPDFTLLRANESALGLIERMTGFRPSEGDSVLRIPAMSPDRPAIHDIQMALSGSDTVLERVVSNADQTMWIEFSYQPVYHPNGGVLGVAITLRDLTERKKLEVARTHALRMESMGLMAGGIAHDFNNLLSAIIGNVEIALLDVDDPEVRAGLDDARDAARRAAELVQQLLQFAGKHDPVMSAVDLSALTREICRYARKIPGKPLEVVEELASGLPIIDADATQLRQLVLNLVVNALDATRETGTRVTVRTLLVANPAVLSVATLLPERPAPSYVVLQVSDDGAGMDEETRARIFDPFFTTKATGHGLGLASALGAVRAHGGTLAIESEPGRGTTFSVFLPAS